jgi:regulatory ArsR family protein
MRLCPGRIKQFPLDLFFRALADRKRLRLLNLIADKEICVCYFVEILRISQSKISRHLAYLQRAGRRRPAPGALDALSSRFAQGYRRCRHIEGNRGTLATIA